MGLLYRRRRTNDAPIGGKRKKRGGRRRRACCFSCTTARLSHGYMAEARTDLAVLPAAFSAGKDALREAGQSGIGRRRTGGQRSRLSGSFSLQQGNRSLVRAAQFIQHAGSPADRPESPRPGGVFVAQGIYRVGFSRAAVSSEGTLLSDSLQAVGEVLHFIFRQTRLPGRARGVSICHSSGHL